MMTSDMSTRNGRRIALWLGMPALLIAALAAGWMLKGRDASSVATSTPPTVATAVPAAPASPVIAETEVTIPEESLERMHLSFAKVTAGGSAAELRVPGTVQPNGYREVHVLPIVGGVITQVFVELGQTVKRGQPLAQIFSRELTEAQTALVTFNAELEAEHKKLTRTQELVKLGAASREELETVEAGHQVHLAHVEEARQKLALFGLTDAQIADVAAGKPPTSNLAIPAPIDGIVVSRNVNLGQVVVPEQDLFTVTDLSTVWIEGSLLENDFASVRVGSRATITTPAYPGRTYRGTVSYIDPRVDPQTRTARVRVSTDNPGLALRLGMYMDMVFTSSTAGAGILVPAQAIQLIGSANVVYLPVVAEPGRFIQRSLKTGAASSNGVSVLEGLKPGDTVVTQGSFLLRAEALRQHVQ